MHDQWQAQWNALGKQGATRLNQSLNWLCDFCRSSFRPKAEIVVPPFLCLLFELRLGRSITDLTIPAMMIWSMRLRSGCQISGCKYRFCGDYFFTDFASFTDCVVFCRNSFKRNWDCSVENWQHQCFCFWRKQPSSNPCQSDTNKY